MQRVRAQRAEEAGSRFNPLDPAVIGAAAREANSQNEAPVRGWLAANTDRLRLRTMDELVAQVRRNVPEAGHLADVEIQNLLREWAEEQNVTIPVVPVLGPSTPKLDIKLPEVVKKAFSIAIDGVDVVTLPGGRLNISARGATARPGRTEVLLGWGRSLGIDIPIVGFQLAGRLDTESWEITLSSPSESAIPDMSKPMDVFQKAETAMRGIVSTTVGLGSLDNVSVVTEAISPHIEPVKEWVQALVDIAKAPTISTGISISGPMEGRETPGAGPTGSSSSGITVTAALTIRF